MYSCVSKVRDTGLHWSVVECTVYWTKWATMTLDSKCTFNRTVVKLPQTMYEIIKDVLPDSTLMAGKKCVLFLKDIFDFTTMVQLLCYMLIWNTITGLILQKGKISAFKNSL